jgi:hypothetical protein
MFGTQLSTRRVVRLAFPTLLATMLSSLESTKAQQAGQAVTSPRDSEQPGARDPKAPNVASVAVMVAMPPRAELQQLLRQASNDAVALAKKNIRSSPWALTTIAATQAKAGDHDGARATFAEATKEAEGAFGGVPKLRSLWRVAHVEIECGLKEDPLGLLQRSVEGLPKVMGDFQVESDIIRMLADIAQDEVAIGARDDAHRTVERLLEFSKTFFAITSIANARDVVAPNIAAALAATGDFKGAFRWSDGVPPKGKVFGEIAIAAAKSLDRERARKFVREVADRLAKFNSADQTYFALSDLAEAQARIGDVNEAKVSAKAIGIGPSRVNYDMTDGQPYALIRIAAVQHDAGDLAGAKETLRDAFRSVRDHPKMRGRDGRYDQVARAQIYNGDLDGAKQSIEAIEGKRYHSLALVARAQAAAGKVDAARESFGLALGDAGLPANNPAGPNPGRVLLPGVHQDMSAAALMGVADIQAMAGDVPGALKTVRSIDDESYQRSALEKVVSARATAGDVAGSLRLALDESKTPAERLAALEGVARGVDTRLQFGW